MALDDADSDLALWSDHLDRTGSRSTVIESHLARFMLVHICGHYEAEIAAIISKRVKMSGDEGVASYVASLLERRTPIHPDSLRGVLRGFGPECLKRFRRDAGRVDILQYTNVVDNRNRSAHGKYIQVTFDEVCAYHDGAKRVIVAFGNALSPRQGARS